MGIDMVMIAQAMVDGYAKVDNTFLARNGLVPGGAKVVSPKDAGRLEAEVAGMTHASTLRGKEPGGMSYVAGGSAANTAITMGMLGAHVAFFGPTGNDDAGIVFHNDMASAGILCFHPTIPGGATGRCLVFVPPGGDRSMVASPGISGEIAGEEVIAGMCGHARLCFCEGFLFSYPGAVSVMKAAAEAARSGGGQVVMSLGAAWCAAANRDAMRDFMENRADIILGNEGELMALYGTQDLQQAVRMLMASGKTAAITRGGEGAFVISGGVLHIIPPPEAEVVDTTGAGDNFAAGFLYGLLDGLSPQHAGRCGAALAGEAISHVGARPQRNPRQVLGPVLQP